MEQPLAHVTALSGSVTTRPGGHQAANASKGAPLYNEDIVSTGTDGKATLSFDGNNVVELGPNTSMVVRKGGGAQAEVGPVLLSGTFKAKSGGHGVRLSIGTPFGQANLNGTTVSVLDVSVDRGMTVEVGTVDITNKDGKGSNLKAGQALSVDGVTVTAGSQAIDGLNIKAQQDKKAKAAENITLSPVTVILLGPGKSVEVQSAGEKGWHLAKKRVALKEGDQIRVRKGGTARLQMGDDAAVNLKPDAVVTFKDAAENASASNASYSLKQGSSQVLLTKSGDKEVQHTVNVGGTSAVITPTLKEANVDVMQGPQGATLTVHEGHVQIGDVSIPAGMAVDLKGGKIVGTPHPFSLTKIELRPKSSVVVYYNKRIPPVSFIIPGGDKEDKQQKIELATDKDFKQVGMAELVTRSFVYDQMAAGKYYWRLNDAPETRAVVQVQQESDNDCANCKRTNVIEDTGEKTVVYFQQALPAIVLKWKANSAAANYELKVFSDGEFDTPLVSEKLNDTKRSFDAGRFEEGKYYWLVTALDKSGSEAASGRMNSLQISYDNVITALVIRSPKDGMRTRDSKVACAGEVELGGKLFINGKRAELDENNRFSESVEVSKGMNQIVFRAVSSDGLERYYLRDVIR